MRRHHKHIAAVLLALSAGAACGDTPPAMPQAAIRSDVLPGSGHSWGFGALDPTRPYLFIARRENGLSVFDTVRRQLVKDVPGTAGANAVAFAPGLDRAFVAYMDGALGIVRLSDMVQLQRIAVDAGNLNNAVFDAASGKLILTGGRREQHSAIYQFDPTAGRIILKREFEARKFDAPLGLADGSILVPLRDEGRVMRISAATLEPLPGWSGKRFDGCEHPSALAADEHRKRLFIACRGKAPQLTVARLDDGAAIAALPTTPAVNALAWDTARQQLLIPSGNAASLSILQREDVKNGEHYRMLGYIGTRPWAHNMTYDAARGIAHLFTMNFTQPAPEADGLKQDPQFHADSFTILSITLGPQPN
ncbi:hypothetical protein [Herbaspirillum sp.]|uniref:YncE family protein n=1 Tax=Herbaspirillum sp. TaxID=1890675 RepID=UPI0031E16EDC